MSRSIVRLVAGAIAAGFMFALSACAGLPSATMPIAQDTHDYVGGTD